MIKKECRKCYLRRYCLDNKDKCVNYKSGPEVSVRRKPIFVGPGRLEAEKMWNSESMQPNRIFVSPGMLKNIKSCYGKEMK